MKNDLKNKDPMDSFYKTEAKTFGYVTFALTIVGLALIAGCTYTCKIGAAGDTDERALVNGYEQESILITNITSKTIWVKKK